RRLAAEFGAPLHRHSSGGDADGASKPKSDLVRGPEMKPQRLAALALSRRAPAGPRRRAVSSAALSGYSYAFRNFERKPPWPIALTYRLPRSTAASPSRATTSGN